MPVGMVSANVGLGKGISAEGFYQFEWQNSVVDGCGTYFLPVDASVGPNAEQRLQRGIPPVAHRRAGRAAFGAAAAHHPRGRRRRRGRGRLPARDRRRRRRRTAASTASSLRMPVAALDTEFGLYAMNYNSRVPILSAHQGQFAVPAHHAAARCRRQPVVALLGIPGERPPLRRERRDQHRAASRSARSSRTRPTSRCSSAPATCWAASCTARRPRRSPCSA